MSKNRRREVPYRESKLTQLLWDGLRGRGRTLMIACCTPFLRHLAETLHTLHYASTAIRIKTVPQIVADSQEQLIRKLRWEIAKLKRENVELVEKLQRASQQSPRAENDALLTDYCSRGRDLPQCAATEGDAVALSMNPDDEQVVLDAVGNAASTVNEDTPHVVDDDEKNNAVMFEEVFQGGKRSNK